MWFEFYQWNRSLCILIAHCASTEACVCLFHFFSASHGNATAPKQSKNIFFSFVFFFISSIRIIHNFRFQSFYFFFILFYFLFVVTLFWFYSYFSIFRSLFNICSMHLSLLRLLKRFTVCTYELLRHWRWWIMDSIFLSLWPLHSLRPNYMHNSVGEYLIGPLECVIKFVHSIRCHHNGKLICNNNYSALKCSIGNVWL